MDIFGRYEVPSCHKSVQISRVPPVISRMYICMYVCMYVYIYIYLFGGEGVGIKK